LDVEPAADMRAHRHAVAFGQRRGQRRGEYVLSRVRAGLIEEGTVGRLAGHPQRDAAGLARADLRQP
jgi:hypothetical protein